MKQREHSHISDLHAPILLLMDLEHEQLSFFYQGMDQRLTGVEHRRVIEKALV